MSDPILSVYKDAQGHEHDYLSSHNLARLLLDLPDDIVTSEEHGELLVGIKKKMVATTAGLIECLNVEFR